MSYAQHAGLADPRCQLYMLFYYIGPASVAFTLRRRRHRVSHKKMEQSNEENCTSSNDHDPEPDAKCTKSDEEQLLSNGGNINNDTSYGATSYKHDDEYEYEMEDQERIWPSKSLLVKASAIALFDIFAQSMVYTGECFFKCIFREQ